MRTTPVFFTRGDFGGLNVEQMEIRQNKAASQAVLDIQILDGEAGLQYAFDYSASRYKEKTMVAFRELFERVVAAIIDNAGADDCSFKQLKECVSGKKSLMQKIKNIFKTK